MCGKFAGPELIEAEVDGAMMFLCPKCARFSSKVTKSDAKSENEVKTEVTFVRNKPDGRGTVSQHVTIRTSDSRVPIQKKRKFRDVLDTDKELVENFGQVIKNARIAQGISLEDFAQMINEKATIIQKIEKNEFNPSDQLITKIERKLRIALKEEPAPTIFIGPSSSKETTLGDVVKLRKKKK